MNLLSLPLLILLGGAVGTVAGYLGIGGGVILVPVLTELFLARDFGLDRAMTCAFATSLFTAVFTTGFAAWQQLRQNNLIIAAVPWTAAGAIVGGQGGAWLGSRLPGDILHTAFGLFLLLAAVYLGGRWRGSESVDSYLVKRGALAAVGLITGVVAAWFGIGGGILMVPAFIFLFRFPGGKVAGTSSAVAFLITISGVTGYLLYGGQRAVAAPGSWGVIDLAVGIPLALGTSLTAGLGARLNKRYGGTIYRRVFALFLAVVAVRMLFS